MAEIAQNFLRYTINPHVRRVENELDRKFTFHNPGQYIKLNANALVRATMKDRFLSYKIAIGGNGTPGWMSPNQIRDLEDMDLMDEEGYNKPYLPPDAGAEEEGGQAAEQIA